MPDDTLDDALNDALIGRERSVANLQRGREGMHGGWGLVRRGTLPALGWTAEVQSEIDELVGYYISKCGGPDRCPLEALVRIRQLGRAFGFCSLVEHWLQFKGHTAAQQMAGEWEMRPGRGVTHFRHGSLPKAITRDWVTFANLQRKLDEELRPFFVENQARAVIDAISLDELVDLERRREAREAARAGAGATIDLAPDREITPEPDAPRGAPEGA